MKVANVRVLVLLVGAATLLALPVLLAVPGAVVEKAASGSVDEPGRMPVFVEAGGFCLCLHPDTDPAQVEEILRSLPTYVGTDAPGKEAYNKQGRWSVTSYGATGSEGDPCTLGWSFVPDGTIADGVPSDLYAVFTAAWGGTGWITKIRQAWERWDDVLGASYIETADDGSLWPNSPGIVGVRGDCRMAGRSIDGPGNVLAYNYYPNGGDMLLDTDDVSYFQNPAGNFATLKNVVMHEHGHGLGLGHVIPTDCTKLMEAYSCGAFFIGVQDDDIRGGQRLYGDKRENDDTPATATVCGTLTDTLVFDTLSIDRGTDEDWFLFSASTGLTVWADPIGESYMIGNEGGGTSHIATDSIMDIDFCLYDNTLTLLDSVFAVGLGGTEVLTNRPLPYDGDYYIKVFRKAGSGSGLQRYILTLIKGVTTDVAVRDLPGPASLDLRVAPNPFNPTTTAKFYTPSAGSYSVSIFDVGGRLARTIEGRSSNAGWVEVPWDGKDDAGAAVASGVYLMRVNVGGASETARAILVR
jgi:hypothetical protein